MKRISTIILAAALLIGMAQCKKQETPVTPNDDGKWVHITMKVGDGDKYNIYPNSGAVVYTDGDTIYVGNNGKYIGALEYRDGTFSGDIYSPSTSDYLHFFFVSGLETGDLVAGTTASFTVDISDQSSKLPVVSYGHSTQKYTDATATYSCKLENKCGLVKFVPAIATSRPVTVSGMKTTATIDFAAGGITPTGTTGGIRLYSESDVAKWAVLLQQDAVSDVTVTISGYEASVSVPTITNNYYNNSGVGITMTAKSQVYEINSSNWQTVLSAFNAEPTDNPILLFTSDIPWNWNNGNITNRAITRSDGIIDFDGHTVSSMFLQNDVAGKSLTLINGTISGRHPDNTSLEIGIDSKVYFNDYYHGTIILENMTVNDGRVVFPDGHLLIIQSGTYSKIMNTTDSGGNCPGKVIINGGYFRGDISAHNESPGIPGTFEIYGGKYTNAARPDDSWCASGYSVKSNPDEIEAATYPWIVSAD